jgi:hypothetical protein
MEMGGSCYPPVSVMVGAIRFERTTPWSRTKCATRLRYAPTQF